jgi:hypothetical protein
VPGQTGRMPRNNRRRSARREPPAPLDLDRATGGGRRVESFRGADWVVRPVSGPRAVKAYRCPGCDQEVPPGVPHLVVWPFDGPVGLAGGGVTERRHWHTPCWAARDRRRRRP